ncbi:hypothetical protein SAMN04488107_4571 [Geodermatophilus saharensis]|uniref:Uncharacterized protein n=1 Tax=Geodermatophilus saharensis TaxID=1137994 RepID=A0A239J066_9ACTN|nr:hypothetical protein [Geodermatophilus saharensis]SNS99291.1 hypothetical protein SAMN04488107_4571 [Geodermatophilus saharensis]
MDVDDLERRYTLAGAVRRYDELRARDSLADPDDPTGPRPLSREEALELLALGEVIVRRAAQGRQLTVRTARTTGASWAQIGRALGATRQSAWEAHRRWIDAQVDHPEGSGGLTPEEAAEARAWLANDAD